MPATVCICICMYALGCVAPTDGAMADEAARAPTAQDQPAPPVDRQAPAPRRRGNVERGQPAARGERGDLRGPDRRRAQQQPDRNRADQEQPATRPARVEIAVYELTLTPQAVVKLDPLAFAACNTLAELDEQLRAAGPADLLHRVNQSMLLNGHGVDVRISADRPYVTGVHQRKDGQVSRSTSRSNVGLRLQLSGRLAPNDDGKIVLEAAIELATMTEDPAEAEDESTRPVFRKISLESAMLLGPGESAVMLAQDGSSNVDEPDRVFLAWLRIDTP